MKLLHVIAGALLTAPCLAQSYPSRPVRLLLPFSAGVGTFTFLAAELFKHRAALDMLHVPYRSGGEALTAVLSGETSVYFAPVSAALPQVKQSRLRPLAVTSSKRLPLAPDVPTIADSGYPQFEFGNWYGIVVPAKTPREIIDRVRSASAAALGNPGISKRLQDAGFVLIGNTPEEFGAYFRAEIEAWGKIVRELKLSAD